MASHPKCGSELPIVLQAVPEQLWDGAVCAYQEMKDQEGLYAALRWIKSQAYNWVLSNQACYVSMLLYQLQSFTASLLKVSVIALGFRLQVCSERTCTDMCSILCSTCLFYSSPY